MAELPTYSYMPGSYMNRAFASVPDVGTDVSSTPLATIDTRGEFKKGFSRGVDSLQQMGYGAAGLTSDIVGADSAKEYFYGQAQEQQKQMEQSPAAIAQFTDIANAGDLGKWFLGAVGEALPSSAASLIGSGVGAAIFKAAALKMAGNAAVKGALVGQVEQLVAGGMAKELAEKEVVKGFFKSEIMQTAAAQGASKGAYAGAMTMGSGMESGSNWLDDVQKYGLEGTNPIKDLAFGVAGGAVEAGLGAERRLIGKLHAQKVEKEMMEFAARKGILGAAKTVGGEVLKSSAGEGGEEFTQQLLSQASTMRNASLDDMLYAKQDYKAAFNAGMAGAAGGVLFGATGGARAHLGSRGYEGSPETKSAAEAILERNRATTEVATQKIQTATQRYDAGLAQLDAGRQKLMENLRQISISTAQNPAQQQQLMSQVQQQLIDANAQRVNLAKEKDTYLEEAKKELTKFNKKTELEVIEAQAEELVKAPKSLLDIKTRVLEEERKATGLAAVDTHAQREIDKVDNRITEHQKAIEAINNSMTNTRRNGGVIGNENVDLLRWHEQQIADERRYAAGVLKEYNKAKDTKSLEESRLFDLYRDKDHAANLTAFKYQDATRNVADSALSSVVKAKKDAASKTELPLVERLNNLRLQNVERSSAANNIDGMTRAISASTRMHEINNVLKPLAQRRDVERMAQQVAGSMRSTDPTVASVMPLFRAQRPLGAQVQPSGYQTLLNNRKMAEMQKQQELATAQRQGAIIALKAVQEKEKSDKTAYQKLSMDRNKARNEGQKRLVSGWIANTLAQLKSLKDSVKVLHSDEMYLLPDYVQAAYSGKGSALIDLNTSTIYLFADKMHNKQHAVRTLLHEGVAHFGLRAIMTPDQLDKFLHMVAREFVGTDKWKDIANRYKDYDTFSIAEEYVAKYAEELRLDEKTMTRAKLMFEKVKAFFRQLLEQLGIVKVTDQDIKDVLLASAYNLTQGKSLREQVKGHSDSNYRGVLNVNYAGFYSPLQRFVASINVNPNKPMPAKFWLDQIFPKGQLRQGLNEEEMQYYKDQMGGMDLKTFLTKLEGFGDPADQLTTKTELIKALAAYFDQVGIEEVVQESKRDQTVIDKLIKNRQLVEKNIFDLVNSLTKADQDWLETEFDARSNNLGTLFTKLVDRTRISGPEIYDMDQLTGMLIYSGFSSSLQKFRQSFHNLVVEHSDISNKLRRENKATSVPYSKDSYVTKGSTNSRNFLVTAPALEDFNEGHTFGDKDTNDTIFWIRTSDIKDRDGNKVLHIEEVQSDRIQEGLKIGFTKPGIDPYVRVPYTPLVQGYNLLAIKRMIAFAAENGYDKVSWTSGEAQIDRWENDLRKNIKNITWEPVQNNFYSLHTLQELKDNGVISKSEFINATSETLVPATKEVYAIFDGRTRNFMGWTDNKEDLAKFTAKKNKGFILNVRDKNNHKTSYAFVNEKTTTPQGEKTLEELVGKDMAKKIMAEPSGKLEGEGLSIGGQGFIKVYDGEMVNQANRYLKNLDPSVRVTDLPFAGYKMHSFPVTEQMKAKIENGQPVYGRTLFESRDGVADDGAWRNVRESREFNSMIAEPIARAKELLKKTNSTISNGVINVSEKLTMKELLNIKLADSESPMANVYRLNEILTGTKTPTMMNWYMADKAANNKEARETAHFNREMIGWDPTDPSFKAKEGSLAYEISKLATPGMTVKELWEFVGKVLAYYHTPEANKALAARSINSKKLANTNAKIDSLKAEQRRGGLTPNRVVTLTEELAKAEEVKAEILNVRQDLFMGVSTEDALKFIDENVNKSPNKLQWMKVIQLVQDINKIILDKAVNNELIAPEFRKLLDETYEFYVPNRQWTAAMERRNPNFKAKSQIFNETNYKFTVERKGSDTQGMNPIQALILKHADVVVAAQSKKDFSMLADWIQANPVSTSALFIEDDKRAVREASNQLKAALKQAETLMPNENLKTIADIIRGLHKRIKELSVEQLRHQRNLLKYTTNEARAKADNALMQIEADIANARETIELLKDKKFTIMNSPAYAEVKRTIKANREALQNSRKDRGWTRSYNELGELVWTRNPSKFTGQMDKVITLTNSRGETTRYMVTSDIVLAALKGNSTIEAGAIIRFLGNLQRKMAMLMTTLNPVFTFVNGFRDFVTANVHLRQLAAEIPQMGFESNDLTRRYNAMFFGTSGNQKRTAVGMMYKYAREGTTGDPVWDAKIVQFEKSGAYTTMFNLGSHTQMEKSLIRAVRRAGNTEGATKELMYATMNWLTDTSGAVENASRFSAYVVIHDALVEKGMSTTEASKIAGDAALDLTVNFTKRGQWGPIISSLFLFGQANINSTVRIMKAMFSEADRGKPVQQRRITRYLAGLTTLGFMMSMLAREMGGDDDDGIAKYDKLSDNKKDSNIVISLPGIGGFLTLPVTFGYQLFYTMGSVMNDMMAGRVTQGEAFGRVTNSALQNFFLVGGGGSGILELTPSVFKPLVQVAANTNYFGTPVHPEAKSWEKGDKPDSQKFWKNTPGGFKYFAEVVNSMFGGNKDRSSGIPDISPASLNHLFRSYFGGVGDLVIKTSSVASDVFRGRSDGIKLGDIPLISRFAANPTTENTLHEFTKYKREVETQVAEYKRAKEDKVDSATMQKIAAETAKGRILSMKLAAVTKQMAAVSAEENKNKANSSMSDEAKYQRMLLNEKKSEAYAKSFIRSAVAAGVR